uniref:Uncharacterized protein n=1 Tax=Romanomermis culicivorax TaxID=13658 RepID=A0A915I918_ROMCU
MPSTATGNAKRGRSGSNGAGGRTRTTTTTTSSHSRSSGTAADHQSTPVTFEYAAEKVRYLKWTAFGLSIALTSLALALTITGTAATLYTCQESHFASYTPLIAIVLLAKNANICYQLVDLLDEDENEIPYDNFRSGRVALVLLSFVAVFASVVTLTTLLTSFHTTGEPVYLYKKRKVTSYVVGDPGNVPLSFLNLDKNAKLVLPNDEESKIYNEKREKFGAHILKFSTSTMASTTTANDSGQDNTEATKIIKNLY